MTHMTAEMTGQQAPGWGTASGAAPFGRPVDGRGDAQVHGAGEAQAAESSYDEQEDVDPEDFAIPPRPGMSRAAKAVFLGGASVLGLMVVFFATMAFLAARRHSTPTDFRQMTALEREAQAGVGVPNDPMSQLAAAGTPVRAYAPRKAANPAGLAAMGRAGGPGGSGGGPVAMGVPMGVAQVGAPAPDRVAAVGGAKSAPAGEGALAALKGQVSALAAKMNTQQAAIDAAVLAAKTAAQQAAKTEAEFAALQASLRAAKHGRAAVHKPVARSGGERRHVVAAHNRRHIARHASCVLAGATDGSFGTGGPAAWVSPAPGAAPVMVRAGEEAPCVGRVRSIYSVGGQWVVRGAEGLLRTGSP